MRSFPAGVLGLALLAACGAPEVQSQRLKDGSWFFQCELPMAECVRRAEDSCPQQSYSILEGSSETHRRDAPPYERTYHTSRLHLVCDKAGGDALITLGGKDGKPATAPPAGSSGSKPALCGQGQTRECVGPGACKGGQACLQDGAGFGICDCGPAPAAVPVTPDVSSGGPAPSVGPPAPSVAPDAPTR